MRSILTFTVATAALIGSAALADPGGNGKQGGGGGKPAAHGSMKAGGGKAGAHAEMKGGDHSAKANARILAQASDKGQGQGPAKRNEKAQGNGGGKPEDKGHGNANADRDRGPGDRDLPKQADRKPDKADRPVASDARDRGDNEWRDAKGRPERPMRADVRRVEYKGVQGRRFYVPTNERVRIITDRRDFRWADFDRDRYLNGCPPGLAKKNNGCMPPGLARDRDWRWYQPGWYGDGWDRGYRYRYYDGYMLRLDDRDLVLGYVPLLGGALGLGQIWPSAFAPVTLPAYYSDFYGLGPVGSYRYYDDAIFRVDPETAAITSIAALLTGNDITIGRPMPLGYDVYNVPFGYRDQYFDGPDALYRYSDGYIYQLDPATRLVQAAIELLV